MRDLHLTRTQAKHDAAIAVVITNTPTDDQSHATANVAIAAMRVGRPTTVVPPMGAAAGAAAVAGVATTKLPTQKVKIPRLPPQRSGHQPQPQQGPLGRVQGALRTDGEGCGGFQAKKYLPPAPTTQQLTAAHIITSKGCATGSAVGRMTTRNTKQTKTPPW